MTYEEASLWIQALGFIGVILSIWFARRGAIADHDRRKKQATIEYLHKLRPSWRDCHGILYGKFEERQLSSTHAMEIWGDAKLSRAASELLNLLEHLSVGVNTDVYDVEIVDRACGSYLIRLHEMMSSYIKLLREKYQNPRLYSEFSLIVRNFEKKRLPAATTATDNTAKVKVP